MANPLFSFIIPLYNCEKYIERSIESLMRQGLPEGSFEIIVVNDGSKDNGPQLVIDLQMQNPYIKLVNQENKGAGMARNAGIDRATGDYVLFLDADDILVPGGLSYILDCLDNTLGEDIVFYRLQNIDKNHSEYNPVVYDNNVYFRGALGDFGNTYGIVSNSTSAFFRREFIADIRFKKFTIGEDLEFMLNVFKRHQASVTAVKSELYCYLFRNTSAMYTTSKDVISNMIDNYIFIYQSITTGGILSAYNVEVVDPFVLTHIQCTLLTKLLSVDFSRAEIKVILNKLNECHLLPIKLCPNKLVRILKLATKSPLAFCLCSNLYRRVYLKHKTGSTLY